MNNSSAVKIFILLAGIIVLGITYIKIRPAPDWRNGVLYIALPPQGMGADAAFELELSKLFAQYLHVKTKSVTMDYTSIFQSLASKKIHMAAAGIRSNSPSALHFGPSFQTLQEQVVCSGRRPRHLKDLNGRTITVVLDSAQEYALRDMTKQLPNLHWKALPHKTVANLLEAVAKKQLDCTVANEEQIASARNFFPKLPIELDLNSPSQLAWAFPEKADPRLVNAAKYFFTAIESDGTLERMIDHHYGHNERIVPFDAAAFINKTRTVLPNFKHWFKEASTLTGIDWKLLAALAYQESHWDPLATSFTHVRGMMMITGATADRMNLKDRLDPHESILAGAKYLQLLKDSLPDRIDDKERTWLAMAAYNQGRGHLEDARILAKRAGLNPDVWSDVRKVMPFLSRPSYYQHTKYGKARGGEAVILVETVRLYHDMLQRLEPKRIPNAPPKPYFNFLSHPKLPNSP